jgi:hypothetical protein
MRLNRWSLLLSLPLLLLLMGARQAVLVDPEPVAVPAGVSVEQVSRDIRRALAARGWTIDGERPGQIDASLHLRTHRASVRIDYDRDAVRLSYVSSDNLKYKEDRKKGPMIHGNYIGWVGNLMRDISINLNLTAAG